MKHAFLCLAVLAPLPVAAHPHIFIDTGLEAIVDDMGRLTHIKVSWTYDEFYSLLVTEDMQLDQDFDGVLTPEEEAQLRGFDMNWDAGYYGDLRASVAGQPLELSRPMDYTASFADGKITSTHLRAVSGQPLVASGELVMRPYDETFYTAYEVTKPAKVIGGPACLISKIEPDIDAELEAMQELLAELDMNSNPEDAGLPNIGAKFATEIRITCAGS